MITFEDGEEEIFPDYSAIAMAYAEVVADGRLPNCQLLQAAARRYIRMREMAEDPKCEFFYSPRHVIDYCSFLEKLKHIESGAWEIQQINDDGSVNENIVLEPWQIWIESAIYGFRRKMPNNQDVRLVQTALTVVPRKSAKSLSTAGAALFELCCSGQRAPQVTIAASTKDQTDRIFKPITKFIEKDADLVEQFGLEYTQDRILCRGTSGEVMKLSSMGTRQDGFNPSLAIMEEAHAGNEGVYNVVRSSFGARPNSLLRMITTAGYKPEGPAWNMIEQARAVLLRGEESYGFFAAVYTLDEDDYLDKETKSVLWDRLLKDDDLVRKANPMFGVSLMPHMLEEDRKEAKSKPTGRGEYARTRFNLWLNTGSAAIDSAAWAACRRENLDMVSLAGNRCWMALDLASKQDMCSIGIVFELPNGDVAAFVEYFVPEMSKVVNDPRTADMIYAWSQDSRANLTITEGAAADYRRIAAALEGYISLFGPEVIVTDPWQAAFIQAPLIERGIDIYSYPNNAKAMTGPTDELLTMIATRQIWHDGNPLLAWNATNMHVERKDNGSIMPKKGANELAKIDGIITVIMCLGCRINPQEAKPAGDNSTENTDPYFYRGIIGFDQIIGTENG